VGVESVSLRFCLPILPPFLPSSLPPSLPSEPVDEDEEPQPHHVHEMPVPGHRLEREVLLGVKWPFMTRSQITTSMMAPSVTCRPWKPVSMKNVEP